MILRNQIRYFYKTDDNMKYISLRFSRPQYLLIFYVVIFSILKLNIQLYFGYVIDIYANKSC